LGEDGVSGGGVFAAAAEDVRGKLKVQKLKGKRFLIEGGCMWMRLHAEA